MKINEPKTLIIAAGAMAAVALTGVGALLLSPPAAATAEYAEQTGKSCGDCHTASAGGGPLTPFGEKFKANGDKMPK